MTERPRPTPGGQVAEVSETKNVTPGPKELTSTEKTNFKKTVVSLMRNPHPQTGVPETWHTTYRKGDRMIDLYFTPKFVLPVEQLDLQQELAQSLSNEGTQRFRVKITRYVGSTTNGNAVVEEREAKLGPHRGRHNEPSFYYTEQARVYDPQGNYLYPYSTDTLLRDEAGYPLQQTSRRSRRKHPYPQSNSYTTGTPDIIIKADEAGYPLQQTFHQTRTQRRYDDIMHVLNSLTPEDEVVADQGKAHTEPADKPTTSQQSQPHQTASEGSGK
jgi:hypothetical protein